ncbi:hypothetical protein VTK26DRAFT_6581 [Humicola hyalothermophila]
MASNPPGRCCTIGTKHEGTPTGKMIKVANKHDAYLATPPPDREHKGVGILILPDVIGIWQNSQLHADQFAANGYLTLLLDTFNGDALPLGDRGPDFDFFGWLNYGSDGKNPHTAAAVDPIVLDGIKVLKEEYGIKKLGGVGYCFGAKYVVRHFKDGIDVGYTAHPSFIEEDELAAITGPFAISAAETDAIFPAEKRHRSEEILKKTGQPYQINLFSGVDHGFAMRGDMSVKVQRFAKEQAFLQAVTWFNEFLLCNSCNVRRIKCSGERPCRQCTTAQRECLYPEVVERVTIRKTELESLQRRCASLEQQLAALEGADRRSETRHPAVASPSSTETLSLNGDSQLAIDGRMLADQAGTTRYLGGTSGATFLDTLKELIATATPLARVLDQPGGSPAGAAFLGSIGQYQTHDSRPMSLPTVVDPFTLPPETEIATALSQLRYFIQDGSGAFGSGGAMFWPFDDPQSYVSLASSRLQALHGPHHSSLALCHVALAFSRLLTLRDPGTVVDGQLGEESFARARSLLGNLLDRATYTESDIAVLALMALYLVEVNRRDAAYLAITNAMTVSIMHGLHKGWSGNEAAIRTFWTIYVIDRWLSCVMGRPPTVPDDAITLPLPRECPGMPPPDGLRAHVQLCRISDYIVSSSYRATLHVEKALELLQSWHQNLPPSLRLPDPLTLFSVDLFSQASAFELRGASGFGRDRACWSLHMNYNQLVILCIRPAMLTAVWKAVASIIFNNQPFDIETHPQIGQIRLCSDAARCNLRLGRLTRLHSPRQKLLLPDLHNIFNAAIILTMHQMIFVNLRTQDLDDLGWATEVFESEAETGSEYAKDCALVLRDLKYLVHQLRNPIHDPGSKQLLRDILPEEGIAMDACHPDAAAVANGQSASETPSRPKKGDTSLYQKVAAVYHTLACWWKADYMQLYNSFLS